MRSWAICLVLTLFIKLSMQCTQNEYLDRETCQKNCLKGDCIPRFIPIYRVVRTFSIRVRVFDKNIECYNCLEKVVPIHSVNNIKNLKTTK